jgi:hypothetical protein
MNMRALTIFFMVGVLLFFASAGADSIPVPNFSFEDPVVQPVYPYAYPVVGDGTNWIELDNDLINPLGTNTGVFLNVTGLANADGAQVAFLGGELGNALLQDLAATYQVGMGYKMTVGICVSGAETPLDPNGLELAFYYTAPSDPNRFDILSAATPAPSQFSKIALEDHSIYLPAVQAEDAWSGKTIGIAIRATGPFGGYWDLDNVRVTEYPLVPNFTDDSVVNLVDFAMMASDWLYCDDPLTDVTGDGCVNEQDLCVLAQCWLDGA